MAVELNHLIRKTGENPSKDTVLRSFSSMRKMLTQLEQLVVPEKVAETSTLSDNFENYAVHTSLIGQVKAGKTALTNALLGAHNLLPSDVNPWTSVVTSVHLNQPAPKKKTAIFKFFSEEEWASMVETGGRLAAMAKKADLDTEVDDLKQEITAMQERTENRLGKNFQLLLNNQHAFSEFNSALLRRYVCLGDDDETQMKEGRFADMTRSADLYAKSESFSYPVTVVDTPGVNDPFLIREAVTLDTLGKADICIIVLSAHQALSTSDLALMRILINLKHEQIVLFINRIDELPNPGQQVREIHDGMRETLKRQNLPVDVPIVFGSAAWAEAAMTQSVDVLPDGSLDSLRALLADAQNARMAAELETLIDPHDLSGMTRLQAVLDEKALVGLCAPFLTNVAIKASDLALQSRAILNKALDTDVSPDLAPVDIAAIEKRVDKLKRNLQTTFKALEDAAAQEITFEMSSLFHKFIFQEGRALTSCLDSSRSISDWECDTEGLRQKLNSQYVTTTTAMAQKIAGAYRAAFQTLAREYENIAETGHGEFGLSKPNYPAPDTPVSLMRTMTFDMQDGWVSGWITRRFRKDSYVKRFKAMTTEQMHAILKEVHDVHLTGYCTKALETLYDYIDGHLVSFRKLANLDDEGNRAAARDAFGSEHSMEHRVAELQRLADAFETILEDLNSQIGQEHRKIA